MFIFFVRRSGAGYYYNKFPFRFVHEKVRNQFFDCSPACLLETFSRVRAKGKPSVLFRRIQPIASMF